MVNRNRIALIYTYSENWIGGTYYIENLIAALAQLPDAQQPILRIFCSQESDALKLQQSVKYKYWSFRNLERKLSILERIFNKITFTLVGKRFISSFYSDSDLIFPLPIAWKHYFSRIRHHLYWIPDFQEHYLPSFFKPEEIIARKNEQLRILNQAQDIVFSSYAVQDDFNRINPNNSLRQHVMQFAVTNNILTLEPEDYLAKYGIDRPYFICSNQFWKHKNHPTVLRALVELLHTHASALVIFTGKETDYRNPDYFGEIMALQTQLNLVSAIRFLGFLPRQEQLSLMQSAIAVIQPSLFEGWSTVIEDAKSLCAPILASNLQVHQEQLQDYDAKILFEPEAPSELAGYMANAMDGCLPSVPYNYQLNIERFAQKFIDITQKIIAGSQ